MKRPSPIKDEIIRRYNAGQSNNEICISLGKNPGNVSNALSEARRQGLIDGYRPRIRTAMAASVAKYVAKRAKESGKSIGCFQQIIGELPRDVTNWLIAETPKGEALTLTIKAIIIDAYHDENN